MVKESKVMSFIVKIGVVVSQFLSCLNILIWDEVLSLVFPSSVCVSVPVPLLSPQIPRDGLLSNFSFPKW